MSVSSLSLKEEGSGSAFAKLSFALAVVSLERLRGLPLCATMGVGVTGGKAVGSSQGFGGDCSKGGLDLLRNKIEEEQKKRERKRAQKGLEGVLKSKNKQTNTNSTHNRTAPRGTSQWLTNWRTSPKEINRRGRLRQR